MQFVIEDTLAVSVATIILFIFLQTIFKINQLSQQGLDDTFVFSVIDTNGDIIIN